MGQIFSALMSYFSANREKEYKIVIVGLDNAGKTTTLYKLHLGEVVQTQPTIGSNVEAVVHDNVSFEVWDLGGQSSLRNAWQSYYKSSDAMVLMVDSTDRGRMNLSKQELFKMLDAEEVKNNPKCCVLVFANKQDLPDAMTVVELTETLGLDTIANRDWHVQACCALSGMGLNEGLSWITAKVTGSGSTDGISTFLGGS